MRAHRALIPGWTTGVRWLVVTACALSACASLAPAQADVAMTVACSPEKPSVEAGQTLALRAWVAAPDARAPATISYAWTVTGGRVEGDSASVTWHLDAVPEGLQTATVKVDDGAGDCVITVVVTTPDRGAGPLGRESARALLRRGKQEDPGYGLYSYVLFGSPPTEQTRERYLQVLSACWSLLPALHDLETYLPRSALNATYVPVEVAPGSQPTPQWALEHYDYARARALLRTLAGQHRDGPYLISTSRPISVDKPLAADHLYQDLSSVPPRLASAWMKEFLNQAAQERFSEARAGAQLALRLRTTLAVVAMGVEPVTKSLDSLVTWVSKES